MTIKALPAALHRPRPLYIEGRENERRGYNTKEAEKRASRGESDLAPEHQARSVDAIPLLVACGADRTVSETPRLPEVSLHPRMIGMPLALSAHRLYSTIPTRRFSYGRSHDGHDCLSRH
jgi:hypothetical protein